MGSISAMTIPTAKERPKEINSFLVPFTNKALSLTTYPRATPNIGPISGDNSIEATITVVLFCIRPNPAIAAARIEKAMVGRELFVGLPNYDQENQWFFFEAPTEGDNRDQTNCEIRVALNTAEMYSEITAVENYLDYLRSSESLKGVFGKALAVGDTEGAAEILRSDILH